LTLIALRLTATEPDAGDTQWTVKDVEWTGDVGPYRVRIQGECEAEVPVTIAR
jgi:hypothetical protein